jgi:hypothetical protein
MKKVALLLTLFAIGLSAAVALAGTAAISATTTGTTQTGTTQTGTTGTSTTSTTGTTQTGTTQTGTTQTGTTSTVQQGAAPAAPAAAPAGAVQVSIVSPTNGAKGLTGTVNVGVSASATYGIYSVQLLVDGTAVGSPVSTQDSAYHYTIPWDTSAASAGSHTLTALATDWSVNPPAVGNQATSAPVTVTTGAQAPGTIAVAITSPANNASGLQGTVNINVDATATYGVAQVQLMVDGTATGSPVTTPASAGKYVIPWDTTKSTYGAHSLTVVATDSSQPAPNGATKTSAAVSVTSQQAPPPSGSVSVSILSPVTGTKGLTGTVNVGVHASATYGIYSVQLLVDGVATGNPQTTSDSSFHYTIPWNASAATAGNHVLTVRATDWSVNPPAVGNQATSAPVTVTTGAQAPGTITVAITSPANNATGLQGTVNVLVDATATYGIANLQLMVDGVANGSPVTTPTSAGKYTIPWNTSGGPFGSHTLAVVATDSSQPAPNGATKTSATVTVTTQQAPPPAGNVVSQILSPVNNAGNLSGTVPVGIHASGDYGIYSVQLYVDGVKSGSPQTTSDSSFHYTINWSTTGVAVGKHILTAQATDWSVNPPAVGNQVMSAPVNVYVGQAAPAPLSLKITAPLNSTLQHGQLPVTATLSSGTGPYSVQFAVDGVNAGAPVTTSPYTATIATTGLADGSHTLKATVTDSANPKATATDSIAVTIDNTPPVYFWWTGTADQSVSTTATVTLNTSDTYGVKSVQFLLDGQPNGAAVTTPDAGQQYLYTKTVDVTPLAPGWHTITAKVTDQAGNILTLTQAQGVRVKKSEFLPVLNYHEIAPPDGYSIYDQTPAEADAQLKYLHDNGYTAITTAQYKAWISGQDIGIAKPVLITVDDGTKTETAWDPIFQKYAMKGILFEVTGFADNTTPGTTAGDNLTWAQIQALAANGRWEVNFHAGQYGHGDSYAAGSQGAQTIPMGTGKTMSFPAACPYYYSCLGTVKTVSGRTTTNAVETPAQAQSRIDAEIVAGQARLKAQVPSAITDVWAAPFNDAGQWTNLYNDPSNAMQGWLPGYLASKFSVVFDTTSPVQYGQASGTVGSLSGFNRRYRFEVHTDTTITQFAAALTDPAFAR